MKNLKNTIFFTSLIAALILPFSAMNFANATTCDNYERYDGKTICVSEFTAQKLINRGWELTKIDPVLVEIREDETKIIVEKVDVEKTVEIPTKITPIQNSTNILSETQNNIPVEIIETLRIPVILNKFSPDEQIIGWLSGEADLSYMQLKKIPNPTGFWTPIQDKDAFARLLVNATGDTIISTTPFDSFQRYTTENGYIDMRHHFSLLIGNGLGSVKYDLRKSIQDESEQLEFINSFMKNMGFKFNDGIPLSVKLVESCDGSSLSSVCEWNDMSLRTQLDKYSMRYSIIQEGHVEFFFYIDAYTKYDMSGITIVIHNWNNNPELVEFPPKPKDVKQSAYDFAATSEKLNKSVSEGGRCEFKLVDDPNNVLPVSRYIIAGVPFYGFITGSCTYGDAAVDGKLMPIIITDAWDGNISSIIYRVTG